MDSLVLGFQIGRPEFYKQHLLKLLLLLIESHVTSSRMIYFGERIILFIKKEENNLEIVEQH